MENFLNKHNPSQAFHVACDEWLDTENPNTGILLGEESEWRQDHWRQFFINFPDRSIKIMFRGQPSTDSYKLVTSNFKVVTYAMHNNTNNFYFNNMLAKHEDKALTNKEVFKQMNRIYTKPDHFIKNLEFRIYGFSRPEQIILKIQDEYGVLTC